MRNNLQGRYTIPIEILLDHSINEYLNCDNFKFNYLKKVSFIKKLWNERQIKKLTSKLIDDLEPYKSMFQEDSNFEEFLYSLEKEEVKSIVTDFMLKIDKRKLLFDKPFLKFFIDQGYINVAEEFIKAAKKKDSQLKPEEIFQALRNVWIMNSLQIFGGLTLEMTPSVYAYSMLYPYTDNFLDNPELSKEEKIEFNNRLYIVLDGEKLIPKNYIEEKVFSLVAQIESQYRRDEYIQVFESLRLIQEAQAESIKQNSNETFTEDMILPISFFKGGTSVLADAFLVKGNLGIEEMYFAFSYGTFLQLLDDLQDAESDKEINHQTLFSIKGDNELIDNEVKRLISYIFKVNTVSESDSTAMSFMKEVISSCTLIMVMEAVGRNPSLVSKELYKELEAYSKVRLPYYKEFEDKIWSIINK